MLAQSLGHKKDFISVLRTQEIPVCDLSLQDTRKMLAQSSGDEIDVSSHHITCGHKKDISSVLGTQERCVLSLQDTRKMLVQSSGDM
jgi:hypothetical protein